MRHEGKHSSVWLVGPFAIKIFKEHMSKNTEKEWKFLKQLKPLGFAPTPYFKIGSVIVMSRVKGLSIKQMSDDEIRLSARYFLHALHQLDELKIMKEESHRPHKHFILTKKGVKLIDFERAKKGKGNVTQFLMFLNRFYPGIIRLGKAYKTTLKLAPIIDFIDSK
ncbi:MAG: hypothetical protein GOV01_02515 [Candidatus Altiarchaeota archaeon]|nr:hypothetical protein [Candidatus Altiarchaeota archaeon]